MTSAATLPVDPRFLVPAARLPPIPVGTPVVWENAASPSGYWRGIVAPGNRADDTVPVVWGTSWDGSDAGRIARADLFLDLTPDQTRADQGDEFAADALHVGLAFLGWTPDDRLAIWPALGAGHPTPSLTIGAVGIACARDDADVEADASDAYHLIVAALLRAAPPYQPEQERAKDVTP